ncbi:Beta-mannosyltransferase 1 [Candida viswanathii]|uniref:Beta-mannosyltransferase 1 n=1 Tax=Candida viswanathii TaxID=5486 RepID=A0A367XYP5_9ASCO|nr:Beta-mannosyltransferase 1 [Candida viswanathii]
MENLLSSVSYTKLTVSKKSIRSPRLLLVLLFLIALLSITTTVSFSHYDFMQEIVTTAPTPEQHEQKIHHQQTEHHDKRIIIFPNNFPLRDNQIPDFYVHDLELGLDPQDLIYRNRLTHKIPGEVSYEPYNIELFDAGTAGSHLGQCLKLSSVFKIEASPAYNKNADLVKVLKRFREEESPYYQELEQFFPNIEQQLLEETIEEHWYQLIGSSVWLEQYGVHLMISRIIYTESDQGYPLFSLSYLQVFDRNWKELDNVELIVRGDDGTYKPILYPQFAPIPVYHNIDEKKGKFYGVEDPRIQLVVNKHGDEEPVIIYNSYHRKIKEIESDNDSEGNIKFEKFRSIFMGWLWRTQKGKSNLEELPGDAEVRTMEYIKIKELIRPENERKGIEKNWSLFLNYQERLVDGYDAYLYFVYQIKDTKILKCALYEDKPCEWEFESNDYTASGKLHGGTELINVNQVLAQYDYPQLDSLKEKFPEGRQIWIGFARAVLRNCGCGSHMYRPNLVVLMKDKDNYKFAYVSPFLGFGIEILEWWEGQGLCKAKNLIIPNGISTWTIEKDADGKILDYMAFTISRRDTTVDLVYIKGLLNALLFDNPNPRLLNHEQQGFRTNTNLDCALISSDKFCKLYGEQHKITQEFDDKEKEEAEKHDKN